VGCQNGEHSGGLNASEFLPRGLSGRVLSTMQQEALASISSTAKKEERIPSPYPTGATFGGFPPSFFLLFCKHLALLPPIDMYSPHTGIWALQWWLILYSSH
jgi:hypothetical protein